MIKLNVIRWLKTLKLCLLVCSTVFVTCSVIIFINYFVSYTTYTNNLLMIIGAYESSPISDFIVSGFSMRVMYIVVYSILCSVFFFWVILSAILLYLDKYCIFKSRKLDVINIVMFVVIFLMISLLVLDAPAFNSLDLNTTQLLPQQLVICYDFTVSNQLVNFILNQDGIIIIVLLSFMQSAAIGTYLFRITRIIQHRYF